jgi:hypothetical protein
MKMKQKNFWEVGVLLCVGISLFALHSLKARSMPAASGLTGWHSQGGAQWRFEDADIVGSVQPGGSRAGWLVRDQSYEDFLLRFWFKCTDCQAGVLFRSAKISGNTEGIYVSLNSSDVGGVYRLTLGADEQELRRKPLGTPHNQDDELRVQFPMRTDGWNEVELDVRGNSLVESINGYRVRPIALGEEADGGISSGLLALGISGVGSQIRIKAISVEDHEVRAALPTEITATPFREQKVTDLFYGEGVAVGDLNRDGHQDLVAGPFYYLGPDFNIGREIYSSATFNPNTPPYTDSFMDYVYDFNGDGWPDVLKVNFEGAYLYINPRGENRHWDVHKVVSGIAAETTKLIDIDGDGRPDLIMSQGNSGHLRICIATPEPSDSTKDWQIHQISAVGDWSAHGMGVGDINGDGRMDVVEASGWWEQPAADSKAALWKFHPAQFGGGAWAEMEGSWAGGADMFVYDVNSDGLPDIITSLAAHGWGLAWFEQKRDKDGSISWKRHMIMGNPAAPDREEWEETDKSVAFSEIHALALADIDGDGAKDIITGKRWWSHGDNFSGPDGQGQPVLYWFQLVRKPGGQVQWVPHLINNNSGVGTQIVSTDVNGDGKPDVVTSARKGTFIFLNVAK